ncbi:MAG TPA: Xaa-Pro aminopeptidase [Candidatus Saccharibacteria bacterium]|nr:Xaa-Pro aminopeptidase [Candidatus Saccharibacteria bacterium]HRQ06549.1 Xaa-Pro aminopeptidase [Candidatus Saccharibacteria bacterium]
MSIGKEFYTTNRHKLLDKLDSGFVVLSAYMSMQRGNDASFRFEQEANFWYLTGINKPDWWVIIDSVSNKSWLVEPDISETHLVFDGGLSNEEAVKISGVNGVISREEAMIMLSKLSKKHKTIHTIGEHPHQEHFNFVVNPAQQKMRSMLEGIFDNVKDCRLELAKMRAIKQPAEIKAMRRAIKLTTEAFGIVKQNLPRLKYEYEVEAEFSYYFRKRGATGHAYDPIVASGKNACTLHYSDNNAELNQNGLILIDVGTRVDGYTADITRTFSLGTPSERERSVHKAVEKAHRNIIKLLKPGLLISDYQSKVDEIMKKALIDLKLMTSTRDDKKYRRYFPHAISHGLGIDVHDSLGSPVKFLPNMVITVEPGIYIPEEGIGVRIEDDILITGTGHENLSGTLATEL